VHSWKRLLIVAAIVFLLVVVWAIVRRALPSYVEYRGEKIKLTKFYLDYDDYKNDPDNIDPSETRRVQRLVSEAPIAQSFADRKQAVDAVFDIKFPGYAAGGFGPPDTADGALNGLEVEIPRANASRMFIFQNVGGAYKLVDDFVDTDPAGIREFHRQGANLTYTTANGRQIIHPFPAQK
jgi:hypothetical protein